jgi:hypothetical protein
MDIFLSGGMGVKAVDHIWHFLHTMFCSYIHDFKVPGEGFSSGLSCLWMEFPST